MNEFRFYPHSVVWETTFACNMRCIHCGTSAGKKRPDELTTQEALNLIDELAGLGCEVLTLSGGEPLLRSDWRELALRSKKHGITTHLISNGYAVDEAIVEDFARIGFDNIGFSFDGTRETHNFIRQREDSYERVTRAMDLMTQRKLRWCAVSQISNINLEELEAMRTILMDKKCRAWRIQMTTTTGRFKCMSDMVLSLDNYPKLIDKLLEFKKRGGIIVDVGENIGYYGCKGAELIDGNPYLGCYAGTRIAGIESNGNVKGCLSMPEEFIEGNIRQKSFTEIWNNPDGFVYNRRFTRDTATGACHDCRYLPLCRGGCTTTSFSQTGERANNPYCMWQIEKKAGVQPVDAEDTLELLRRFDPIDERGSEAV